jgi:PTS system ascorbate-specific IIA component
MAGDLLVASGRTTPEYTKQMIDALVEHGPYMVIAPGIALVHGRPSEAVLETGLSLVTLAQPVVFGNQANDPVRLVIGLCAFDHSSHLGLMQELATFLMDDSYVNSLLNAVDSEQIRELF